MRSEVSEASKYSFCGKGSKPERPTHSADGNFKLSSARKSTLTGWFFEMLCCVISTICLYSIVELLLVYNHKPSPSFPIGITLNSIVALLSSISSAACTFVIAEGVSQMKWNHYACGKSRPLSDLQTFDNASRGVWGSFKLLFVVDSIGSFMLALVVCFVMLAGLISPSVTQSAITNTDDSKDGGSTDASDRWLAIAETSEMRRAVQLGLATPYHTSIQPLAPICPTANCEFPPFTTLAVCSDVRNATRFLTFTNMDVTDEQEAQTILSPVSVFSSSMTNESQTSNYPWPYARNASLPTGAYLTGGPDYFSLNISYSTASETLVRTIPWNHTQSMQPTLLFSDNPELLTAGIAKFSVIWLNQAYFINSSFTGISTHYLDSAFRASEVFLYFCSKRVSVKVTDGSPVTNFSDIQSKYDWDEWGLNQYCLTMTQPDDPDPFKVIEGSFASLFYYLRRKLHGTVSFAKTPFWTVRGQTSASEIIGDALWLTRIPWEDGLSSESRPPNEAEWEEYFSIVNQDKEQDSRLRNITRNLADSLTNMLRQSGGADTVGNSNGGRANRQIIGTAFSPGITLVRWNYLILPAFQVCLSILFLVSIILQTIELGVELYKSELLPVLLAINPADRSRLLQSSGKPAPSQASDDSNNETEDTRPVTPPGPT